MRGARERETSARGKRWSVNLGTSLTITSALISGVAAILWLLSARVKTPETFQVHVVRPDMAPMGGPVGGQFVGHGYSTELTDLANALRRQSKLSAQAAICTAVSVFVQIAALLAG